MAIHERMTKTVHTCRNTDSLAHAARLLWENDCGCLPVVGEQGQLHGMITDRDICMAAYTTGRTLAELQVREAMAIDPTSVRASDSLRDAELAMRKHGVRRLPVLDERDRVIGILTCNDLTRWVDDGGAHGRRPQDATHLVATLAAIGRPRRHAVPTAPPTAPAAAVPASIAAG